MSPPPGTVNGVPRRSEGAKPQESRQSGDGQAEPSAPRSLEAQADRDVNLLKGVKAGIVTRSECPDGWRDSSGGENPRKASTAGTLRGSR